MEFSVLWIQLINEKWELYTSIQRQNPKSHTKMKLTIFAHFCRETLLLRQVIPQELAGEANPFMGKAIIINYWKKNIKI